MRFVRLLVGNYFKDVQKVFKELVEIYAFSVVDGRKLKCDVLHNGQKIYDEWFK